MLTWKFLDVFPNFAAYAHGYAKKTSGHDNYKHFRMSGTDLYNFIYFVVGDKDAPDKLKDPGAAYALRRTTQFQWVLLDMF